MKYWFTSDEHYGHLNIIKYCDRPFSSVSEMDNKIINNHNSVVKSDDIVVHGGDFTLKGKSDAENYFERLNGTHIFIAGSHDYWLEKNNRNIIHIWEKNIEGVHVVVCHYAMRTWPRSFHGSIQLFGHSHGKLKPDKNQYDICVEANNYFPVSFEQIKSNLKI
jgi:calcineurin-like phosphoesterase family protein